MKITISMACSINGIIADKDGNEDFLSHDNWNYFISSLHGYDALVYGKITYDSVITRGSEYIKDLETINMLVLNSQTSGYKNGIYYFNSVEEFIKHCKEKKYEKIMVSGGATTNSFFLKNNLVDEIILYYNPYIIGEGINVFKEFEFENSLELDTVEELNGGIVKINYKIS